MLCIYISAHVIYCCDKLHAPCVVLKMLQLHTYPENIRIYLFTKYAYLWELQALLLLGF
jgi:hypothetical protein